MAHAITFEPGTSAGLGFAPGDRGPRRWTVSCNVGAQAASSRT